MSGEQSITERLASLEVWADARTKEFQKLNESFSKLQRENLDMKNENTDMKTDLFHLREEHKKLVELNANLTATVHLLGSKVEDSFGQDGCTSSLVERVDALETRSLAIEGKRGDVDQSVTNVTVKARDNKLVTNQMVPLDRRVSVLGHVDIDGLWDGRRHRVVVRRDGRYRVGGRWGQLGAGVIGVRVEWARIFIGGRGLGRTRGDGDTACGMVVVELKKGDEVWLVACRREGGARIWGCEMFCWLL